MSDLPKFKLKKSFGFGQPPQHVWIIHTNTDLDSLGQPTFTTLIDRNSIIITLTVDAAREKLIAIADVLANENGWQREEPRDTGVGIFEEGDVCCDIGHTGTKDGEKTLKARISAWKIAITQ